MREVEFTVILGDDDRYRENHIRHKNKILAFTVQFETRLGGKWVPVVRYDTAHGYAHRDLYKRDGQIIKTPLYVLDYNDALTFAESDLKANWKIYKERFLRGEYQWKLTL